MNLGESFTSALMASRLGEEWAWHAIYRDHAPAVRGYLRGRGASDPDDLLGEVFLQVVRDLARFSGSEQEFRAWVLTIAHHRLLDERRRHARKPSGPSDAERLADERIGGDVAEEAQERLGDERVRRILARLPKDQQSVLLLRVIGDLTLEQVARALGKSPGAVKQLQRRALLTLRRDLGEET